MTSEFEEELENVIEKLIALKVIEIHGFDAKSNQITYRLTDNCKYIFPELFKEHFAFINQLAFSMWQKGYIELTFDENGIPIPLLKKKIDYENDLIPILEDDERFFLENLINRYRDDII